MTISEKVRNLAESYQQLNAEERHNFAELVAPVCESDLSVEWTDELKSRANDIDAGRVQLIDGKDFMKRLRAV